MGESRNWKLWELFAKDDEEDEPGGSRMRLSFGDIPTLSSFLHFNRNTIRMWQSIPTLPRFLPLIGQQSSWSEPEVGCQAGGDASAEAFVNPLLNLGTSSTLRRATEYSLAPSFLNLLPVRPRPTLSEYLFRHSIFAGRSVLQQDFHRMPAGPSGSFLLQRSGAAEPKQPKPVIEIREQQIADGRNDLFELEDIEEEEEEEGEEEQTDFDPWAPKLRNFWDDIEADYDQNRICACMGYRRPERILVPIVEERHEEDPSDEADVDASGSSPE